MNLFEFLPRISMQTKGMTKNLSDIGNPRSILSKTCIRPEFFENLDYEPVTGKTRVGEGEKKICKVQFFIRSSMIIYRDFPKISCISRKCQSQMPISRKCQFLFSISGSICRRGDL